MWARFSRDARKVCAFAARLCTTPVRNCQERCVHAPPTHPTDKRSLGARILTYQATRFPLKSYGVLILAFALSCVCYGALVRQAAPSFVGGAVSIIIVALLFMQLRIADEHRDYEDDLRLHPDRPVPAGVVTLRELRRLAWGAAAIQLVLVAILHPPLLGVLFLAWAWIALVWHDFFAKDFLEQRPGVSLGLHLGVLPAFALMGVGADQLAQDEMLRPGVWLFMGLTLATGAGVEIARKCMAPDQERSGVITYSKIWGPRTAGMTAAFAFAVAVMFGALAFAATRVSGFWYIPAALIGFWVFVRAARYSEKPNAQHAAAIEGAATAWVVCAYLSLGVLPFVVRALS
jgi:4-hydroxybenzoate polyprenyltransferase